MIEQFFRAHSTLPRDTYSPACSLTKSFLRSNLEWEKQIKWLDNHALLKIEHRALPCFKLQPESLHDSAMKLESAWRAFHRRHQRTHPQPWVISEGTNIHTHYLETAVCVNLAHVSCAEPPLTLFIYKKVLVVALLPVVTHGNVGAADQDFPSWVWLVSAGVAAYDWKMIMYKQKYSLKRCGLCKQFLSNLPSAQSLSRTSQQIRGAPTRPVLMSATVELGHNISDFFS